MQQIQILLVRNVQGMGSYVTDINSRAPELTPHGYVPLVGPLDRKSRTYPPDVSYAGRLARGGERIRELETGDIPFDKVGLGCRPWPTECGIHGHVAARQ